MDRAQVRRIAMAPVCAHDCFHMHWRWGLYFGDGPLPGAAPHVWGWSADFDPTATWGPGKPNAERGAPMVPHNQEVHVTLPTSHSIAQRVRAFPFVVGGAERPLPRGVWTVLGHHGASYAIFVHPAVQSILHQAIERYAQGNPLAPPAPLSYSSWAPHLLPEPAPALPAYSAAGDAASPGVTTPHWSLFYWRLRFGGTTGVDPFGALESRADDVVYERLQMLDLDRLKKEGVPPTRPD